MKSQKQSSDWSSIFLIVVGAINFLIGMILFYIENDTWGLGPMVVGGTVILMALIIGLHDDSRALIKRMTPQQYQVAFNVSAQTSPNATDTLPYQGRWKDEPVNKL